jgi:hypothetical protein
LLIALSTLADFVWFIVDAEEANESLFSALFRCNLGCHHTTAALFVTFFTFFVPCVCVCVTVIKACGIKMYLGH